MIDDAEFERNFHDVLEDVLGWQLELRDEDGPATVEEWDSLAQIRLVHELETRFGVRLPDDALLEEQSVGSLKRLVLDYEQREEAEEMKGMPGTTRLVFYSLTATITAHGMRNRAPGMKIRFVG